MVDDPCGELGGLAGEVWSTKLTGVTVGASVLPALSLPPPPPLETEAVAVDEPAAVFAVNTGEVARPLASVVAVAWAPPPVKLALATALVPHALALAEPSVNVTVVPATGCRQRRGL